MIPFTALVGPSYTMFSKLAEGEESTNVFREKIETEQGVNPFVLYRRFGYGCFQQIAANQSVVGALAINNLMYFVSGTSLYEYSDDALTGTFAPLVTNDRPAYLAASLTAIMVVSAGHLYRLNGGVLSEIALTFTPVKVVFIDNYFVVLAANTAASYWSDDDGATWDPANFFSFEADANLPVSVEVLRQQLWIIGTRVSQPFSVGTDPDAPFVPNQGALVPSGTLAPDSVRNIGDTLIWIDQTVIGSGSIVMLNGYEAVKISNAYIEALLADIDLSDAIGAALELNGHQMYRLSFPSADLTLEYHKNLNEWEKIEWLDWAAGQTHRDRAYCFAAAFGNVYAGDRTNGWIYKVSLNTYHDFGYPIRWVRRTPNIIDGNNRIGYRRLELGIQAGVGLEFPLWLNDQSLLRATFVAALAALVGAGTISSAVATVLQSIYDIEPYIPLNPYPADEVMEPLGFYKWGADPQIMMRFSADGAETWGNIRNRPMGKHGEYKTMVFWDGMGAAPFGIFELSGTDPVKLAITNGYLDIVEFES